MPDYGMYCWWGGNIVTRSVERTGAGRSRRRSTVRVPERQRQSQDVSLRLADRSTGLLEGCRRAKTTKSTTQRPPQAPSQRVPSPTQPDSLTQSDVASLRAFLRTLNGVWECATERDAEGDLWAALVPHHAGHDGYGAAFVLTRHGATLTLTDASGQTLGRYGSVERAEDALGDAVGYCRRGYHR
jgi:hypothetical protein